MKEISFLGKRDFIIKLVLEFWNFEKKLEISVDCEIFLEFLIIILEVSVECNESFRDYNIINFFLK